LEVALAASETGTFQWDPATGQFLEFDESLKRLLGFGPEHPVNDLPEFLAVVYPEDRYSSSLTCSSQSTVLPSSFS
jgi:hypothetical protein